MISGWRSVSKKSGALQVGGQVLVLDDDRVGVDAALEAQRAVLVGGQRRVVVLEAAAEGRDDHVLDGEADGASGPGRRSRWCRRGSVVGEVMAVMRVSFWLGIRTVVRLL